MHQASVPAGLPRRPILARPKSCRSAAATALPLDPVDAAKAAGLHYVIPDRTGIERVPSGRGFLYRKENGRPVRDAVTLARNFHFRAKHGIRRHIDLADKRLARIVKTRQELRGRELFCFLDEDDMLRRICSEDVNAYLRAVTGEEITAKDFRTWAGTKLAVVALRHSGGFESKRVAKNNVLRTVEAVAGILGNTVAICRKCYIHPAVLEAYAAGRLEALLKPGKLRARGGLGAEEVALMKFLEAAAKP